MSRPDYVLRALEKFTEYGDREAIVGVGWAGRWTYTETRAMVLELAARLRDAGFEPGMTVAIVIAFPPESPMLQLALHLLGCRTAWLEPDCTEPDMRAYLELTRPDRLIYDTRTRHRKRGKEVAEILGVPVMCLGPDGLGPDLLGPAPAGLEPFDPETATGEVESIFQTTGTTGTPKTIVHGAGLYEQMSALADDWVATGQPLLRHFTLTPLWHASGQAIAMLNLMSGGVLFVLFGFFADKYLAAMEEHRANSIHISPLMLNELLDHPDVATTDLSALEMLNVGGSPVTPARMRQAIQVFGPVMRMTYGQSELPYISSYSSMVDDERIGSVGPPYGDVRVEIRDEDGNALPPGEVGELWAASRLAFHGYLGQPELTAQTVRDGWIRTRDLGFVDEGGYLHLVGRSSELIITGLGGEHVYPRPIEE